MITSPFLDTAGRVETLYLAALGRPPREEKEAHGQAGFVRGHGSGPRARLGDVFWALLNSAEFLHNH